MKKYLLLLTLALIVAPLVAAGCASPTTTSPSPSAATSTGTTQSSYLVVVPQAGPPYAFQPSALTVPRGASVTWRNDGSVPHQPVSDTGVFSAPSLNPGQTYTYQFNQTGTYPYHCAIHPYMTGTITVQ